MRITVNVFAKDIIALLVYFVFSMSIYSSFAQTQDTNINWNNIINSPIPFNRLDVAGPAKILDDHFYFYTNFSQSSYPKLQIRGFGYRFYDAPLYGFMGYCGVHYLTDNWDDTTRMSVIIVDTSKIYTVQGIASPDRYWGLRVKRFAKSSAFINLTIMESQARGIDYGFKAKDGLTYLYVDKTKHMGCLAMDTSDYYPYFQVSADSGKTWNKHFYCNNLGEGYFSSKLGIGITSPHEKLEVDGSVVVYDNLKLFTEINSITGSISGSVKWSMPFNGKSYKKMILFFENFSDKGISISYPIEFVHIPYLYGNVPLSIFSSTSTNLTIGKASNLSGYLFIEGF